MSSVVTIPKQKYDNLEKRQEKLEAELGFIKEMLFVDDERQIKASALKKWEKISRDIDRGKGIVFNSPEEARKWLKNL